jgi:transcriptional regulator
MHPNPAFRQGPADRNLAFARARGFGVLTLNGPDRPPAAQVRFRRAEDGSWAELHLVRANPVARALSEPQPGLLPVTGPDGCVSPEWYGLGHDRVPTWNAAAVPLRGRPAALAPQALRPKLPWRVEKTPGGTLGRMMRQIVPCRFEVARVDGAWRPNRTKPAEARLSAAEAISASPHGSEAAGLARLMREAR